MCSEGDACALCSHPAVTEIHWPSWVMKLCETHASLYYHCEAKPVMIFILGDSNENPSVN